MYWLSYIEEVAAKKDESKKILVIYAYMLRIISNGEYIENLLVISTDFLPKTLNVMFLKLILRTFFSSNFS